MLNTKAARLFVASKSLKSILIAFLLFSIAQPVFAQATLSDWLGSNNGQNAPDAQKQCLQDRTGRMDLRSKVASTQVDDSLIIPANTRFLASLASSLDSSRAQAGDPVQARLLEPLTNQGQTLVPQESILTGEITRVVPAQSGSGANGRIEITFTGMVMPDGQRFPIQARVEAKTLAAAAGVKDTRAAEAVKRGAAGALAGAAAGTMLGVATASSYWGPAPYCYQTYYSPYACYSPYYNPCYSPYYNACYSPCVYYPGYYPSSWYYRPSYGKSMMYGAAVGAAAGLVAGVVSAATNPNPGQDIYVVEGTAVQCQLKRDILFRRAVAAQPAAQTDSIPANNASLGCAELRGQL